MKKPLISFCLILFAFSLVQGRYIWAEEGQGYNDVVVGVIKGFVLKTTYGDGTVVSEGKRYLILNEEGTYYFVPNLDRTIMSQYENQKVRITGKLSKKSNTIKAAKMEVVGEWKTVWRTPHMKDDIDK